MQNALSPNKMTNQERLAEVAEILALGFQRLKNKLENREFPLDFDRQESVHGERIQRGEKS